MTLGFSPNELTEYAHLLIIGGVVALYINAQRIKELVKTLEKTISTQQDTIDALQKGFDACKERLVAMERKI